MWFQLVLHTIATLLGVGLVRLRMLPGTTALWGAFPGGASVMVVMSEAYGADMRMVAFMQYLRVVVVAVVASLVGRALGVGGAVHPTQWLPAIAPLPLLATLALIAGGGIVGPLLPIPGAPLLGTLFVATLLQDFAGLRIELPPLLLVGCYVVVGWTVGLRFTRESFRYAAQALSRVLASIGALVVLCAGLGILIAKLAHLDMLTAYFATSPGGADSIAIVTAGSTLDVPLVMSIQMGRVIAVMLFGPTLAKYAARLAVTQPATAGPDKEAPKK